LRELLVEKGVLTNAEIAGHIDKMATRNADLGAKVTARAWSDPEFKQRYLSDTRGALMSMGIDIGDLAEYRVVENTPSVHNVIVCTLCSCYPKLLLGYPPAWYKSVTYRSRTVREPRVVLGEFGVNVPDDIEVRVHDSTADLRYIVLPARPAGTDGWSEERLAATVSRDSLIGTAIPEVA
jgi:nitrile hydratase